MATRFTRKTRLKSRCWISRKCDILTGKIEGKRGAGRQHSRLRNIRNGRDILDAATLQKRIRFALCDKHTYAYTLH